MKKGLAVIIGLGILIAVLSGMLVLADSVKSMPADDKVIVRVYYPNLAIGNKVLISFKAQLLETNYEEDYHVMEVTQNEINLLTRAGLRVEVDNQWTPQHLRETSPLPAETTTGIPKYPCYRTVEETFATAEQIVQGHPNLATWFDVGNSWEKSVGLGGYDMMVLVLTNSAISGPKPKLFLTAAIHAREYATAELVTRFAEYLVNNYGTDADATWILDHHEVHLMLQTNPDGRKQAETGLFWRKNTNQNYCGPTSTQRGADINRNFFFQWNCCGGSSANECAETYHGPYATSEPETQAVQNYEDSIFPDQRGPNLTDPAPDDATGIFIDVHSYGRLVLWPWGFTSNTAPNATQLQTLGRKFAYWNGYSPEQAIGLYPTDGASDDHAYGKLGVASYTFEVGTAFFQSCSYFDNTLVPANIPALVYAAKVVRTPYMTPSGPDVTNLSVSSDSVPAGTLVTLSGTMDDTLYNNSHGSEPTQNIAAAEYYVDIPQWVAGSTATAMSASDGRFDSQIENVEAMIDTTGWSDGEHILFIRGKDANNNWGAFSAIFLTISNIGSPDLIEISISNPPAKAQVGSSLSVTDTAKNQGNAPSGASATRYYFSLDTIKSSEDKLLTGSRSAPSLLAGATSSGTVDVTIPSGTAAKTYYLLACADDMNVVAESNEDNNCFASTTKVKVTGPDLIETSVSNPPATTLVGSSFSVTDTVKNQGNANSGTSTTRYYFSLDTIKDSGDKLLTGTRSVPALAVRATSNGTVTVTVPSDTPLGLYYLVACSDDTSVVAEINERNNCKPSTTKVQVSP